MVLGNEVLISWNGFDFTLIHILISALCIILIPFLLKTNSSDSGGDVSVGLRREMAKSSTESLSSLANDDRVVHPIHFKQFRVLKRTQESHNTVRITLDIPGDKDLGLKIGRHVSVKADIAGNKVIRAYTPVSRIDQKGSFEICVKRYDDGKLSNYIWNLKVGDWLDVRGPVGRYQWKENAYPVMGLIAAGSGITPALQLIRSSLECPVAKGDRTKFILMYQNRTESDILMRALIEELTATYPDRLQVVFFLSKPPHNSSSWNGGCTSLAQVPRGKAGHVSGYIDEKWVNETLHFNLCPHVCICGPSSFNGHVRDLLCDHGHDADTSVFIW